MKTAVFFRVSAMLATIMLLGACVSMPTRMSESGATTSDLIEPGGFLEACTEAAPSQRMTYAFESNLPVSFDVHYHDSNHQKAYLVKKTAGQGGNGTVIAPLRTTYCLFLTNGNTAPVRVKAKLETVDGQPDDPATMPDAMGPHGHAMEGATGATSGHEMEKNIGPMQKKVDDYIRAQTPAGYTAVIGRRNPLPVLQPKIVHENGQIIKEFNMTVEDVSFEIFPGKMIQGWGFNGLIPGPTIRVQEGDRIRIHFTNHTDNEHTIHIHGQPKPLVMDGIPYISQKPVAKGETFTYEFTVTKSGTHWYHCHVDSAHHVDMGMYGAFIVDPRHETIPFDREYTLILDEWPTAHIHVHGDTGAPMDMGGHEQHGTITEHPGAPMEHHLPAATALRDWYPKTFKAYAPVYDGFTINGRSFPYTEPLDVKEGERVRIRLINAGYQAHFIHIHSHKFQVVTRDGSPVNEPQMIDTVEIGPGQRLDIIMLADNPGVWPVHCHRIDHIANDKIYPGGMLTFLRYVE